MPRNAQWKNLGGLRVSPYACDFGAKWLQIHATVRITDRHGRAFKAITARAMKNATNVSETNLNWEWASECGTAAYCAWYVDSTALAPDRPGMALKEIIEGWLSGFVSREEAIAALEVERVPCAPVLTLREAMGHPHLRERGTVRRVKDREIGEFQVLLQNSRVGRRALTAAPFSASTLSTPPKAVRRRERATPSDGFRTIQVYPKDLRALSVHPKPALS